MRLAPATFLIGLALALAAPAAALGAPVTIRDDVAPAEQFVVKRQSGAAPRCVPGHFCRAASRSP